MFETITYTTFDEVFNVLLKRDSDTLVMYLPVGPYTDRYIPNELSGTDTEKIYLSYCAQMEYSKESPLLGFLTANQKWPLQFEAFPVVVNNYLILERFLTQVRMNLKGRKENIGVSSIPKKVFIPSSLFTEITNIELLEFEIECIAKDFPNINIYFGFRQNEQSETEFGL